MASAVLNDAAKASLEAALQGGAESAGSTLSGLLSRQVALTPAGVSSMSPQDLAERFMGGIVHVPVTLSGSAGGKALLVFQENVAAFMADLMVGGDGSNPPESLSDLHVSAVGEVGSQLATSLLEGLGTALGKQVGATTGDLAPAQAAELANLAGSLGSSMAVAEFALDMEGGPSGTVILALSGAATASLTGAGAPPAAAPTAAGGFKATTDFSSAGGAPLVQSAQMGTLPNLTAGSPGAANLELLMDVPLNVTVELGRTQKLVREVLALGPGSVVELDKLAGEPVDILVNEKPIAKGEVVVIDENFGIRVTEILSPRERLNF